MLLVWPPRGVIALEKLPHSWEANVEDFLGCTVRGGWGRLGQGGWWSWVAMRCGWVVGGGVTVGGVTGWEGLDQLWGVALSLLVGLPEPGRQAPLLPQAQCPFMYF